MTKQEILRQAVGLVSSHPQVEQSFGQTTFTSSAEFYYDLIVPSAMEEFVYGFGIMQFNLTNPAIDTADNQFINFDVPDDTGFIFFVGEHKDLPSINMLRAKRGLRRLCSDYWSKLPDNKIRVVFSGSYDNSLVMGYTSKSPNPETFSASFTNYVIESIASRLALKNIQQRNIYETLAYQAMKHKHLAQKYALDNSAAFNYEYASLASAPQTALPSGETANDSKKPRMIRYLRG